MKTGQSLYRWFRDIPIARKLYFTVGTMACLIGVELFVLFFSLHTLSSLRAYVGGEGLWSKAEKDAVFHLYRYGVSRTETDYRQFERFMQVPLGDGQTRDELLKRHPNMAAATAGFLAGRNHPDDVAGMINLFVRFGGVSYINKAIAIWGEAQSAALQLLPIARQLRQEVLAPQPSQQKIDELLASIYAINEQLTALEDSFSFTLGEGSRWLESVVLRLLFATAVTVEITGLVLAIFVTRGMQKGLNDIIRAARLFSTGSLSTRANVRSHDEIGVVADAFNAMADERQRAEAELRAACAQLEIALRELQHQTDERLRAEEMLRQSEKLRALGQLTGGIAHDFNNLLGVIIGNVEFLADAVQDQPQCTELAREILNSALSGSALTRRLLAVGRNQPLQPQRVDLKVLLAEHADMLRRTLGDAIQVEVRHVPDLWLTSADPSQIGDALLNLALNARDAMPHGGRLTIAAANYYLDTQGAAASPELEQREYVVLTVADTGCGMPPAIAERAIEPFFTTKPPAVGSGLGLSMAYGFAKQSGGHLEIDSVVGSGTKVTLYLPRATEKPAMPRPSALAPTSDPTGNETILLVDDNETLLMVTRRRLTGLGYKVIAAKSGPSALAILETGHVIDLLFTDMVMPDGITGGKLAAEARRLQPRIKVLLTTGYPGAASEHLGEHLLGKPYGRRDLARAVRSALEPLPMLPGC